MSVGAQTSKDRQLLSFVPLDGTNGITVVDRIERRHLRMETSNSVTQEPISAETFAFPVDEAISIHTDRLSIPDELCVVVWNSLGFAIAEVTDNEALSLPRDQYVLELHGPIRIYLAFDAACSISVSGEGVTLELDDVGELGIGARSSHKRPAATITTSDEIEDLIRAISYFGSGLKTTTCERSYPSHRGHPPTVELGDQLSVPSVLRRPDTGVTIEVPPVLSAVYTSATLAYYLGAELVPGETPRIVTDDGFVHRLAGPDTEFESEVARVLKQVFFLDCITRTEGLYQVGLHERTQVEPLVDFDFADLYDRSLATQLETYLDVPYHRLEPFIPKWKLTAHMQPDFAYVETLPFLVNDLAVIKIPQRLPSGETRSQPSDGSNFTRAGGFGPARTESSSESATTPPLVRIDEDAGSMEQTWIGEGALLGASKAIPEAFYNRLGRRPSDDDIDITIVCNAEEMGQESDLVDKVYRSRAELPFDVTILHDLSIRELRSVLQEDIDFLHYIGHIDARGFECTDGRFDASSLESTGVGVFFLNACTSYQQGAALIRAGGIAGVVTLEDVINSGAERVGMALARLLNGGFPLRAAMTLAREESIIGGHYLVLGDGGIDVAQPVGFVPALCQLTERGDRWHLRYVTFPTSERGMGAISTPLLEDCEEFYLTSGENGEFILETDQLRDFMELEDMPVLYDGELTWSGEFELSSGLS